MKAILKNQSTISAVGIDSDENHLVRPLASFIEPTDEYHLLKVCTVDTSGTFVNPGGGGSTLVLPKNQNIELLSKAARTATITSADQTNEYYKGLSLIVFVESTGGTVDIDTEINCRDSNLEYEYVILRGEKITTTGTYVFRIYPGLIPSPTLVANDVLPFKWNVKLVHNNSTSATYKVVAQMEL